MVGVITRIPSYLRFYSAQKHTYSTGYQNPEDGVTVLSGEFFSKRGIIEILPEIYIYTTFSPAKQNHTRVNRNNNKKDKVSNAHRGPLLPAEQRTDSSIVLLVSGISPLSFIYTVWLKSRVSCCISDGGNSVKIASGDDTLSEQGAKSSSESITFEDDASFEIFKSGCRFPTFRILNTSICWVCLQNFNFLKMGASLTRPNKLSQENRTWIH